MIAMRLNARDGDVQPPSAPKAGPAIEPAETSPMTPPTISPRRSAGAFAVSHAIDAPQQAALATPCAARAATSTPIDGAKANATVATVNTTLPAITTRRAPTRPASHPVGTAAIRIAIGSAASTAPASAFDRSNFSA